MFKKFFPITVSRWLYNVYNAFRTLDLIIIAFDENKLMIDIRMHLKETGGVRNHGTGFRIAEKYLIDLYQKQRKLL